MSYLVKTYMDKEISTVDADVSALEASKTIASHRRGYLIVLEKGLPAGIVTERDLVQKVMATEVDPQKVKVSEVMSTPLITVDPDATVEDAVKLMVKYGIRRLPVVREGILYGMFGSRDLAKHFKEYEDKAALDLIRSMTLFSLPW